MRLLTIIMATLTLQPIAEAVRSIGDKTPVGSVLRSAEWAQMPRALRNRAQFSAAVESARVLNRIQSGLESLIGSVRQSGGTVMDRSKLIGAITGIAESEGLRPSDPALQGGLRDITSERRAELIYEIQTGQAYGAANWKAGQDEDALDAVPAQELIRIREAKVPRDWVSRWEAAGGQIFDGRLIALKTDPIWSRISRFGNPYPPFDFGSGMWVQDVSRAEAIRYGILQPNQKLDPIEKETNENLEASIRDLRAEYKNLLKETFGPQIDVDGDRARWKPESVSQYEALSTNRRQSSPERFRRVRETLGAVRSADAGIEASQGIQGEIARTHAVEISAVASGRKPLFHEDRGVDDIADLTTAAHQIQAQVPQGVVVRVQDGHLYAYNPDLVSRLAAPGRPLWEQVQENRDNGRWLGYGVNQFDPDAGEMVRVLVTNAANEPVYGFRAPKAQARIYGAARARDWIDATGLPHSYLISPGGGGA